jgi:hypothetical protein
MAAGMTWLDQSVEQQRRVRELVNLFAQRDSRDELGIGQVRGAFSDALFPGTSVIQTRARYFLFVPWLFIGSGRGRSGARLLQQVQRQERRLIETLRAAGAVEGLIGRQAGTAVKLLPSSISWNGLQRWNILTVDRSPDQLGGATGVADDGSDELALRREGEWHPTLPAAPDGFPEEVPEGFDLSFEEAVWLRERVLDAVPDSLLAHLVARWAAPAEAAAGPWDDPIADAAPDHIKTPLHHSRLFSLAMHGAALLYNLLLAEAYQARGYDALDSPIEQYRDGITSWHERIDREWADLIVWDRIELRSCVAARNPNIAPRTWSFINDWLRLVIDEPVASVGTSEVARSMVADRERLQKGRQARLTNEKLLAVWSGASGVRPLTYRWDTARTILTDIANAREAHRAGA